MKLCTVVGARPQFIKAATVSRIVEKTNHIEEAIIHTGQHYDANMSDCFFSELNIPKPKYSLNIGSGNHGEQTGKMLVAIEQVLLTEKPDWVLVYGDTNSTLAGALAAVKLHIPVAHVESGLRSFNRKMPEEINRIATDHISELLFVPTDTSHKQLIKEGINEQHILNCGDVMFDATLYYNEFNSQRQTKVEQLGLNQRPYILSTIHRAENTDDPKRLKNIFDALIELSSQSTIVLPLHPRTRSMLAKQAWAKNIDQQLMLVEPLGYLDMLAFEKDAQCIITDSGGVQKEAYFNQVPCITLRDETEWVELVESGWNQLCSPQESFSLIDRVSEMINQERSNHSSLYGHGDAAEKIVERLTR